jgi:flotillin
VIAPKTQSVLPEELGGIDSTTAMSALVIALAVVLGFALLIWILKSFLYVCKPNEILIFAGRKHRLKDGSEVGYRILHGGRAVRVPLLETVARMDMRLIPVEVAVTGAYSRGGIPLNVHAIANVKLASDPTHVRNAVERFLGSGMDQVAIVAQQTLEGVLREVLAQLTPEEVNEDRLKFAQTLMLNAKDDFETLGLELDVLKVQHVSDDQQYLVNLGRARIAEMIRDAKNAENAAEQRIQEEKANARRRAEMAQKVEETRVLQKRNEVRAELAGLEAQVRAVENEATVAAETARAVAEQLLQQQRGELEKLRLECDVVLPAEANRQAEESRARGDAAPYVENGKASAAALAAVAKEWQAAGSDAKDLYVLQELRSLVEAAIARVNSTQMGTIEIVDGGDGAGYSGLVASYPAAVGKVLDEMGHALGVDIGALVSGKVSR